MFIESKYGYIALYKKGKAVKAPKIPSETLRDCALKQLEKAGTPLEKLPTRSRAMLYEKQDGETVRIRTTNDPVLIAVADSTGPEANLNIEGTDHLLIVMPEAPRTPGPVLSYFVPTDVAVSAVRKARQEWLESNPNTKGDNRTWNIWFTDKDRPGGGFADKWSNYLIPVPASTDDIKGVKEKPPHLLADREPDSKLNRPSKLLAESPLRTKPQKTSKADDSVAEVIENAKHRISVLTGVPEESVRIEVKIGS